MERPICWMALQCEDLLVPMGRWAHWKPDDRWVNSPNMMMESFNPWANKEGREEMILIHEGQEAKAIKHYEDRLASDSDRQEALFGLTVAHARLSHADNSISFWIVHWSRGSRSSGFWRVPGICCSRSTLLMSSKNEKPDGYLFSARAHGGWPHRSFGTFLGSHPPIFQS